MLRAQRITILDLLAIFLLMQSRYKFLQTNKMERVFCNFSFMKEAIGINKVNVPDRTFVLFPYSNLKKQNKN